MSINMPSMSNTTLSHMLTNLIFTTNPWDWFYCLHLTDVKTKIYGGSLFEVKMLLRSRPRISTQVFRFQAQSSFMAFMLQAQSSQSVILSLWLILHINLYLPPLSRIFLKFASSRNLWHISSVLCILLNFDHYRLFFMMLTLIAIS